MPIKIEKASEVGFCFGVKRAIDTLEAAVQEHGHLETLGEVVHNDQVLQRMSRMGIKVINSLEDIKSDVVAISAHGVTPQVEASLRGKNVRVIDTTCPFVRRAQMAARKLAEAGFFVVIYGDAPHQEVKGILGWAQGKGLATLDAKIFESSESIPRFLGILSQTTQIPENFTEFAKKILDLALTRDAEIRVLDTICHDIRKRQSVSLELAKRVNLMLVVGGSSSANTRRLLELCSSVTEAHLIDKADAIDSLWIQGKTSIGVASGTSTQEQAVDEVVKRLELLNSK